jgi:protein-S-isoprenylcysteine O-methyltransferase Ste14
MNDSVAAVDVPSAGRLAFSMTWRLVLFLGVLVGIIGIAAGRWDLWFVWAYALVYVSGMIAGTIVVYKTDPTLFQERLRPGPGGKDPKLRLIAVPLMLSHMVIAGMDIGRRGWSGEVPDAVRILGLVILAVAMALPTWAMSANRFFSSDARIQRDRGHHLVTGGPYQYIRHPGYLGAILMMVGSPLALGSYVSGIPMLLVAALIIRRLRIEEELLFAELDGYTDYGGQVRYRLLPGVW